MDIMNISLRDYFAGQAISLFEIEEKDLKMLMEGYQPLHKLVAKFCYDLADEMIAHSTIDRVVPTYHQELSNEIIQFGKFKGTPYNKLGGSYLFWLWKNLPKDNTAVIWIMENKEMLMKQFPTINW